MPVTVLAQHAVRPAARRFGKAGRPPVGAGIGIGQIAEPATADRAGISGARRHVEHLVHTHRASRQRRRDDGPGAEPFADQRGGRGEPAPGRGVGDRAQHRGALPRSPSRSIRTG